MCISRDGGYKRDVCVFVKAIFGKRVVATTFLSLEIGMTFGKIQKGLGYSELFQIHAHFL